MVAVKTVATIWTPRTRHVIADFDAGDPRTRFDVHNASTFVTNHSWQVHGLVAVHGFPIGVTEAAGGNLDAHFVWTGICNVNFFNGQFSLR